MNGIVIAMIDTGNCILIYVYSYNLGLLSGDYIDPTLMVPPSTKIIDGSSRCKQVKQCYWFNPVLSRTRYNSE